MQMLLFLQQDYHIKYKKNFQDTKYGSYFKTIFFVQDKLWRSPSFSAQLKIDVATFYHLEDSCKNPEPLICFATL
jgi:hypothetical protein